MAYSYVEYEGNGETLFPIPFEYISAEYVHATVDDVPVPFTLTSPGTLQLDSPLATGTKLQVYRDTEKRNKLVQYRNDAVLDEKALELSSTQTFHISQEAYDEAGKSLSKANRVLTEAEAAADLATATAARAEAVAAFAEAEAAEFREVFETDQTDRKNRFDSFILSAGYQDLGEYKAGIKVTARNQVIYAAGEFWKPSAATVLPYSTTGAGMPESDAFVSVGDAVLRQDLADPAQGAAKIARGVVAVDSIADLLALPPGQRREDLRYLVQDSVLYWDGSKFAPSGRISLEAFGARPEPGIDNGPAFEVMYNFLEDYSGVITAGGGVFYTDSTLLLPKNAHFKASKGTVISAEGSAGSFTENSVVLQAGSEPLPISGLASAATKGEVTLIFELPHGRSDGDVILIYNPIDFSFSNARPTYRAGEYCTVAKVLSSTSVLLERPLYGDYDTDVSLYECTGYGAGGIEGVKVIAPGPGTGNNIVQAISFVYMHGLYISCIRGEGSDNCSVSISRCYKVTGKDIDAHQWGANPGFATQYGLSLSNTQDADITGRFVGNRHGVAVGGANLFSIPCRTLRVHDFVAINSEGSIAAADWHGNAEFCTYENGQVFGGGFNFAGDNNRISNVKGIGKDMMPIQGRELLGCNHVLENAEFWTGRNDTLRGLLNIGSNESPMTAEVTRRGGTITFRGIKVEAPNSTRSCIAVRNRGYTGPQWDVVAEDIEYIAPNCNSVSDPVVWINTVSGDSPATLSLGNIRTLKDVVTPPCIISSGDASTNVRGLKLSGSLSVSTSTSSNYVTAQATFAKRFPRSPHVVVTASVTTTGGDGCVGIASAVSRDGLTARFQRIDSPLESFTGAIDVTLSWTATLDEF